jgi:hypothetical protein
MKTAFSAGESDSSLPRVGAMRAASSANRRGLVLGEVVVVLALLGVLAMLLVVTMGDSRRNGRLGQCQANLRFFAMMTPTYAADNSDLMWGLSWKKGVSYPGFGTPATDMDAHAFQAIDIMRRRGGPVGATTTPPGGWLSNVQYSGLVLADYRASASEQNVPMIESVCPGDVHRFKWNRDPVGFKNGQYVPNPEGRLTTMPASSRRWAFSSTYQFAYGWFDRATAPSSRVTYSFTHSAYIVPGTAVLGQPTLPSVRYPSSKVLTYDTHAFHAGARQAFLDYPEARVSLLMADGSAAMRSTSDANLGWNPSSPTSSLPVSVDYSWPSSPRAQWYAAPLSGSLSDAVTLHYTSTRDGIYGRDFDGPPAETGQP